MSRLNATSDEQFASLIDLTASSPRLAQGVLANTALSDPALAELGALAESLRSVSVAVAPSADPAFRDALRQRLVAVATVQVAAPASKTAPPVRSTPASELAASIGRAKSKFQPKIQQRLAAVVGATAILTSVAGVGVAAANSLPGNPFYGVKKATESVQLWTARGNVAKGKLHLEFARDRLSEAQQLSPSSSHLASTLAAMNDQTTQGTKELITAYQSTKSTTPLKAIATFTQQQQTGLQALGTNLPPAAVKQEQVAVTVLNGVVTDVNQVAKNVCLTCLVTGESGSTGDLLAPITGPTPSPAATTKSGAPLGSGLGTRTHRKHARKHLVPGSASSSDPTSGTGSAPSASPSTGTSSPTPAPLISIPPLPIVSTLLGPPAPTSSSSTPKPTTTPTPILSILLGGLGL